MTKIPEMHSNDAFDRSNDLELEVGDDLAAYKMTDEELEELLDDILLGEECECGEKLDENGICRFCDFEDEIEPDAEPRPGYPPYSDEMPESDFWEGDTPDW